MKPKPGMCSVTVRLSIPGLAHLNSDNHLSDSQSHLGRTTHQVFVSLLSVYSSSSDTSLEHSITHACVGLCVNISSSGLWLSAGAKMMSNCKGSKTASLASPEITITALTDGTKRSLGLEGEYFLVRQTLCLHQQLQGPTQSWAWPQRWR